MPPKRKRAAAPASESSNAKADTTAPIASNDGAHDDAEDISSPSKRAVNGDAGAAPDADATSSKKSYPDLEGAAEPSDAEDDEPTSTRIKAQLTVDPNSNHTKADARMDSPPRAGIVDPVGYHTNPPPEGRTVRVYADGVFDLFHLGYAFNKLYIPIRNLTRDTGTCGNLSKPRRLFLIPALSWV